MVCTGLLKKHVLPELSQSNTFLVARVSPRVCFSAVLQALEVVGQFAALKYKTKGVYQTVCWLYCLALREFRRSQMGSFVVSRMRKLLVF